MPLLAIETPVVEVHISDIYAREPFRHHSYLKPHCITSIVGQGLDGYRQAIFNISSNRYKVVDLQNNLGVPRPHGRVATLRGSLFAQPCGLLLRSTTPHRSHKGILHHNMHKP
jgi:hypothetical protein